MCSKRRIQSIVLLAIYLLVVWQQNVLPLPEVKNILTQSAISHQHGDFQDQHHEHQFHVGIFHFLGHLLEKINQEDNPNEEHLYAFQERTTQKAIELRTAVHPFIEIDRHLVCEVDAYSLSDPPPYHLLFLRKLTRLNTPLRAPPAIV